MNKTFRAAEMPLVSYANKPVLDCDFTFVFNDDGVETAYDFSAQDGLFLSIYDRKDGKLIKEWTHNGGLTLAGNTISWNEYGAANMAFALGRYYYEIGYLLDDYTPTDIRIVMAYGDHKFI